MLDRSELEPLIELVRKILVFLGRPVVQLQLLIILVVLLVAWLITRRLSLLIAAKQSVTPASIELTKHQRYRKLSLQTLQDVLFPGLSLLALSLTQFWLVNQGQFAGLLTISLKLFWIFFCYRFALSVLYLIAGKTNASRYRIRLLAPVLFLIVAGEILGLLTPINELAAVVLATIFESSITLGEFFISTVGLYLWIYGVKLLHDVLSHLINRFSTFESGQVEAALTLGQYLLIGLGIIVVSSQIGLSQTTLAAITGGLSVGIGFGLREILGNFISGIGLLFEGSLRPGDVVEVEGEVTTVKSVSIRATTVSTFDNIEKIVPNQNFFTSTVTNYTGKDRIVRVLIPVGVSYNCDPEEVIHLLLAIAQQHPKTLPHPKPSVHLMGYGDFSVDFRLAVFIDDPLSRLTMKSDLYRKIWKTLAAHHIEIPFPQRDLHIRSGIDWQPSKRQE